MVDFGLGAAAVLKPQHIKMEMRWNLLPPSNLIKEHMGTCASSSGDAHLDRGFVVHHSPPSEKLFQDYDTDHFCL